MGKLADLLSIKTANVESFVYTPPAAAFGATRILVKPQLGLPDAPPATVSTPVLHAVLRGLRRANPPARIVVADSAASATSIREIFEQRQIADLLDDNMRMGDLEELTMTTYLNTLPKSVSYATMTAPAYLSEYDCVISLAALHESDTGQVNASLHNLLSVFPRSAYPGDIPQTRRLSAEAAANPAILQDVYFTVGHFFAGAIVALPDKVIWGDDLLAVDEAACKLAGVPRPDYIDAIRTLRTHLSAMQEADHD
ncbi:MAG: DUF362 domain-containing protein [Anaerolineae bacterium]